MKLRINLFIFIAERIHSKLFIDLIERFRVFFFALDFTRGYIHSILNSWNILNYQHVYLRDRMQCNRNISLKTNLNILSHFDYYIRTGNGGNINFISSISILVTLCVIVVDKDHSIQPFSDDIFKMT